MRLATTIAFLSAGWLAMHAPGQAAAPMAGAQSEAARWTAAKFGGLAESLPGVASGRPPLTTEPPFSFTYDGKSFRDLAWKPVRASRRLDDCRTEHTLTYADHKTGLQVRRNPHLHIDSCASGGRRNDLETMRRAVPLLRSDWSVTAFAKEPLQIEGNQAQTYGLSSWLPWQGVGVPFFTDRYAVRSYYVTGFGMVSAGDWTKDESKRAGTIRGYTEVRRIAPLMLEGDYYPLTPYSLALDRWIAWQFHRPEQGDGVIQAFRRPQCVEEAARYKLRGLDPRARYAVTDLDTAQSQTLTGRELMDDGLPVMIKTQPGAAVLTYTQIK